MLNRIALRRYLALATLVSASALLVWPAGVSHAGDTPVSVRKLEPYGGTRAVPRGAVIGGYSTTLSEIWGPPEMPPAPKDFGPHFDFPPEPLNGGVLHDPYPN
jgi:hypothetical protein